MRTKKLNLTATRNTMPTTYEEDDDGSSRLSGAFVVVLLLHVVAIVGVFAFSRINEGRVVTAPKSVSAAPENPVAGTKPATPKASPVASATTSEHRQSDVQKAAPAVAPAGRTYVVKTGDNLTKIAIAYSTQASDLVSINSLKNENDIRAGQVLTIPEGKSSKPAQALEAKPVVKAAAVAPAVLPAGPRTYVVQKGDTVAKIARDNKCTYEELVKLNNIKDPKKIQPGQPVKIPAIKKN